MQNRFYQIVIFLLLVCLVFTLGAMLNGVEAASKRTYKSDITVPNRVQALLDQRAAEGWKFVAISEGSQDNSAQYLVLVFEKE